MTLASDALRVTARDLMTKDLETVSADMSVRELGAFLADHEISGAPVEDARGELIGIVSASDVARASAEGGLFSAEDGGLGARPYDDDPDDPVEAEDLDDERGYPVESKSYEADSLRVRDIMAERVYTINADATVAEVAEAMLEAHLHRLLVTEGEAVVGIVSTLDLLQLLVRAES